MVDMGNEKSICRLAANDFGKIHAHVCWCAILSVFPHRKDPEITGTLLEVLVQTGVEPDALAHSPSAVSVVLKEDWLSRASDALFEPFSFGTYRTPADWKLAQKGKEELYREVVASYQEGRPKVYGLDCLEGQEFLKLRYHSGEMGPVGSAIREFARLGLPLTFLATGPCRGEKEEFLALCLPASQGFAYRSIVEERAPGVDMERIAPVAVFSMNGPHFGDRYGVASELLTAFERSHVDLLGLSCTVASITGVVRSSQSGSAVSAIEERFDVPRVISVEEPVRGGR
jgi:hypothetical protein